MTCSACWCKFATPATARLSDAELHDNLRTLVIAGFLTTTHLLSNGLALLLSDPHLAAAVREAEMAVADFVEETLRYEAPVQMTARRAAAPAELGGMPVTAGTQVLLLMGVGTGSAQVRQSGPLRPTPADAAVR